MRKARGLIQSFLKQVWIKSAPVGRLIFLHGDRFSRLGTGRRRLGRHAASRDDRSSKDKKSHEKDVGPGGDPPIATNTKTGKMVRPRGFEPRTR